MSVQVTVWHVPRFDAFAKDGESEHRRSAAMAPQGRRAGQPAV